MRRPWANLGWRLRLSTLILLIIIFAMGLTIVIQQRREARLSNALRSAQNLNDEAIREALDQPIDWQPIGPQTLSSVLGFIRRRAGATVKGILWNGVPIYVDPVGLQEAEVTMSSPVTVPPMDGGTGEGDP